MPTESLSIKTSGPAAILKRLDSVATEVHKRWGDEQRAWDQARNVFDTQGLEQATRQDPRQLGLLDALGSGAGKAAMLASSPTFRTGLNGLDVTVNALGDALGASQGVEDTRAAAENELSRFNTGVSNQERLIQLNMRKPLTSTASLVGILGKQASLFATKKTDRPDWRLVQEINKPVEVTEKTVPFLNQSTFVRDVGTREAVGDQYYNGFAKLPQEASNHNKRSLAKIGLAKQTTGVQGQATYPTDLTFVVSAGQIKAGFGTALNPNLEQITEPVRVSGPLTLQVGALLSKHSFNMDKLLNDKQVLGFVASEGSANTPLGKWLMEQYQSRSARMDPARIQQQGVQTDIRTDHLQGGVL